MGGEVDCRGGRRENWRNGGLRVFVRIRIFRIGVIFRILVSPELPLFAIAENPAKTGADERLPVKDAPAES